MAYECFHTLKKKTHGNSGFCPVKLDMNKAYDRSGMGFLGEDDGENGLQ